MTVGARLVAMLLSGAQPGPERLLLCRPVVAGDPALARADALVAAARDLGERFLDYGVVCDGEGEAARAARRAGLGSAVSSRAEGRGDGSRYQLVLSAADESVLGRRELVVAPGEDAVAPLRRSLSAMAREAGPEAPGKGMAPWLVVGGGAAALAAGAVLAAMAGSAAADADRAATPQAWADARSAWRARRTASGILLGAGGAAAAAGLAWRFAF